MKNTSYKGLLLTTKVEVTDVFFTNFHQCDDEELYVRNETPKKDEHPTLIFVTDTVPYSIFERFNSNNKLFFGGDFVFYLMT